MPHLAAPDALGSHLSFPAAFRDAITGEAQTDRGGSPMASRGGGKQYISIRRRPGQAGPVVIPTTTGVDA
jgi:hypothetical protein